MNIATALVTYDPGPPVIEYAAGFMFNDNGTQVLLIKKNRPQHMAGLLNAIGGHMEGEEMPMTAMIREFKEETGVTFVGWTRLCELIGTDPKGNPFIVYFFCANSNLAVSSAKTMEEEPIVVHSVNSTNGLMSNLNWLMAMAWNRLFGNDKCTYFSINESEYSV